MKLFSILPLLISLLFTGCRQDKVFPIYETEFVVVVVIDGPRYSETWGNPTHQYIPNQSALLSESVFFDNFMNDGITRTVAGHTAITTGVYQTLDNSGVDFPINPSIFQMYLKHSQKDQNKAWIIASKDKLEALANCTNPKWKDTYMPSTNCGNNGQGVGSGYRHDSLTMITVMDIFNDHHPNLTVINFREPDYSGHNFGWQSYILGIQKTDEYVQQIWDFIQNDPIYKNRTTLFVTNDHGRHLDGVGTGFQDHGDDCDGCRHISLLALGPDFKSGTTVSTQYDQTDLNRTIAQLLHFYAPKSNGDLIVELFE